MQSTIIYLIRHGQSEHNRDDLISGHVDPALTEVGVAQAMSTKQILKDVHIHEVYSSDLSRAVKTAEIVSGKTISPDNKLKSLREKNYGSLEGKSNHELAGDRKSRLSLPKSDSWAYKHVPDMESDEELADRLLNQIKELAEKHNGQTILIGSHGTAIRVVLMRLLDKHYNEMPKVSFKNGGYVKLVYSDREFSVEEVEGYS
jgi:broad specificity phosphatase PhoE